MIIYYTVPEIWCVTDVVFVFHFGLFFGGGGGGGGGGGVTFLFFFLNFGQFFASPPPSPLTALKIKILKK